MALPLTGLTLHCDAKDTDNVRDATAAAPSDNEAVLHWDDEGDGAADVLLVAATTDPLYRSGTPLMKHACIDFDGADDFFRLRNQADSADKALSTLISAAAHTIIFAFYPETIANTSASPFANDPMIQDQGGFMALSVYENAGVKKLRGYNWDGDADAAEVTITAGATWIGVFQHSGGQLLISAIDEAGVETVGTPAASGDTADLTNAVNFGRTGGGGALYDGRIGEFAIWNVALTGSDLTDAKEYFKAQWLNLGGGGGGGAHGRITGIAQISHPTVIT